VHILDFNNLDLGTPNWRRLERITKVGFLATAQHDEENPWLPNERGDLRISAMMHWLDNNPDAIFVIGGGYANHRKVSYADRMALQIAIHYPHHLKRLALVSGFYNRTIDDVFQGSMSLISYLAQLGVELIPAFTEMHFSSEGIHYARTEATIRTCGYNPFHIDSGADNGIYDERDLAMAREVNFGKLLGLGLEAVEWNNKALENATKQAQYCADWAAQNPELDEEYYQAIRLLLLALSEQEILIESHAFGISPRPHLPIPRLIPIPVLPLLDPVIVTI
jgi:hypothetical protein